MSVGGWKRGGKLATLLGLAAAAPGRSLVVGAEGVQTFVDGQEVKSFEARAPREKDYEKRRRGQARKKRRGYR